MTPKTEHAKSRTRTAPEALVEQGAAFMTLEGDSIATGESGSTGWRPETGAAPEKFDVIVIGGGQAGLSAGYHLRRMGMNFVILDASARIGDAWRKRWDSLRLFTPARFSSLDGMPFPAAPFSFPTKDEMADYLEAYARRFRLPVRNGMRVTALKRAGGRYLVTAGGRRFSADQVIVAAASYQKPHTPGWASELDPAIVSLHSAEYRNPGQLQPGPVLLVGAGNSGAELARELVATHRVLLSGGGVGEIPFRVDGFFGRHGLVRLTLRGLFHRVLTVRTPPGRKVRAKVIAGHSGPLIRVKQADLAAAGVERVPRVDGFTGGRPRLQDGRVLDVANVIWCTGFRPGLDWIDLPILDERGDPRHVNGIASDVPGLYFVGLHFQYALSSGMIHGVGRDARNMARAAARFARQRAAAA